ncbi:MAG: C40 family peptidase [Proteobacteria bacterium]|nr:C40 family peptidase [Pseudomonadota bacterium]MBU1596744.1 C40 family peptidase [Pseudomonadota bacterium]
MTRTRRHTGALALLSLLLAAGLAGGCAPAHIELDPLPGLARGSRSPVVAAARSLTGAPYKWGGESPQTGFDCSGLTWWAYRQVGVDLPRVSYEQYEAGRPVGRRDIRPGDLVFFRLQGKRKNVHVGIATDQNSFIHSPSSGGRVREEDFDTPYWQEHFIGARRLLRQDG